MLFLTKSLFDSPRMDNESALPPVRRLYSIICKHCSKLPFTRIDHRAGPGWMSDSYKGMVCMGCSYIVEERRVY